MARLNYSCVSSNRLGSIQAVSNDESFFHDVHTLLLHYLKARERHVSNEMNRYLSAQSQSGSSIWGVFGSILYGNKNIVKRLNKELQFIQQRLNSSETIDSIKKLIDFLDEIYDLNIGLHDNFISKIECIIGREEYKQNLSDNLTEDLRIWQLEKNLQRLFFI